MDIGRAFTFFLDDPGWFRKVLLGALISLIPLVGSFILIGWALAHTRNVYYGSDIPIPEWDDIGNYLVRGLIAWLGALVWALPLVILSVCTAGVIVAVSNSDAAVVFVALFASFLILFAVAFMAIVLPVPLARYAIRGEFGAMFEFDAILAEVRRGIRPLMLAVVIWLVASLIVVPIGLLACFVGVYVTSVLSYLMIAHAMGQAYRQIDSPAIEQTASRF